MVTRKKERMSFSNRQEEKAIKRMVMKESQEEKKAWKQTGREQS